MAMIEYKSIYSNKLLQEIENFLNQKNNIRFEMISGITGSGNCEKILKEIIKWFSPDKKGNIKLSITRCKRWWMACTMEDWSFRMQLSERQCRYAIEKLEKLGIISTQLFHFNRIKQVHITFHWKKFLQLYHRQCIRSSKRFPKLEQKRLNRIRSVSEKNTHFQSAIYKIANPDLQNSQSLYDKHNDTFISDISKKNVNDTIHGVLEPPPMASIPPPSFCVSSSQEERFFAYFGQFSERDRNIWLSKYDQKYLLDTVALCMKTRNIRNKTRWMQKALDNDYVNLPNRIRQNKRDAEDFVSRNRYPSLDIFSDFVRDSVTGEEQSMKVPSNEFISNLDRMYKKHINRRNSHSSGPG